MDTVTYRAAAALAGAALLRERKQPQPVHSVTGAERNAIYIVCDITGKVLYVGSTVARAAHMRLAEHLGDKTRTRYWAWAWVVPLRADVTPFEVRYIEGRIGRYLRPSQNVVLPSG